MIGRLGAPIADPDVIGVTNRDPESVEEDLNLNL
jgi:hypothetical protein